VVGAKKLSIALFCQLLLNLSMSVPAAIFLRKEMCSDKLFRFINTRMDRFVESRTPNREEAWLQFLEDFNLKYMPVAFESS
jgi:hypothetical protein